MAGVRFANRSTEKAGNIGIGDVLATVESMYHVQLALGSLVNAMGHERNVPPDRLEAIAVAVDDCVVEMLQTVDVVAHLLAGTERP